MCHPGEWRSVDQVLLGDIRDLPGALAPRSVALVVTSPPYFSGKEYETAIGQGHVPESYSAYLAMLSGVLAACAEALEPGGRMAVNVANLGRKPYRSLSGDVARILEEELGLLLRGEVIWAKAKGAAGNCAWGTYQRPGDPVLRDLTERVVIASKGRFDRAIRATERANAGFPSEATIFRDEFLEATVDLWEIPPESATRVGHPAPFPAELPRRLIDLYTYRGDLVLDPFMGSGTTAVAALRTGRHFVGFDTDPGYVAAARARAGAERQVLEACRGDADAPVRPRLPAVSRPAPPNESFWARGVREGRQAKEVASWALQASGLSVTAEKARLEGGVEVGFVARDEHGREWLVDVAGSFGSARAGLARAETLWKVIGKAAVIKAFRPEARYVVMTTATPAPATAPGKALAAVVGPGNRPIFAVVTLGSAADLARLAALARLAGPAPA